MAIEKVIKKNTHRRREDIEIRITSNKLLEMLGEGYTVDYKDGGRKNFCNSPKIEIQGNDICVTMSREKKWTEEDDI